jgi:hypothetical protein
MREARLPYTSEALLNWRPVPVLVETRSFPCQDTNAGRSPESVLSSTRVRTYFVYTQGNAVCVFAERSHRYPPVFSLSYLSL